MLTTRGVTEKWLDVFRSVPMTFHLGTPKTANAKKVKLFDVIVQGREDLGKKFENMRWQGAHLQTT